MLTRFEREELRKVWTRQAEHRDHNAKLALQLLDDIEILEETVRSWVDRADKLQNELAQAGLCSLCGEELLAICNKCDAKL